VPDSADLFRTIARLRDTLRRQGVVDQEFNGLDPAWIGGIAVQLLEHGRHAQRVIAGVRHRCDADPIGLKFLGAGVIDLMLNTRALGGQNASLHRSRRAASGGRPEQNCRQHGRGRNQSRMALFDHAPHDMALRDMRRFMGHDPCQFVLVAGGQDQTALDGNESARHGEGIDDGILQHEVVELVLALFGTTRQAVTDLLDVVVHLRVFEHLAGLPDAGEPAQACLVFLFQRYCCGGRASQIRQILPRGAQAGAGSRFRVHARGPADPDACADGGGHQERAQGLQQGHSASVKVV